MCGHHGATEGTVVLPGLQEEEAAEEGVAAADVNLHDFYTRVVYYFISLICAIARCITYYFEVY